jgi:hypothetical protein
VIAITFVSVLVALAMSALVVKMMRDERRRAEARVEALMEMVAVASPPEAPGDAQSAPRLSSSQSRVPTTESRIFASPSSAIDLPLSVGGSVVGVGALFAEPHESSPWLKRLSVIGAIGIGVVLLALAMATLTRNSSEAAETASVAPRSNAPLELLSMRHTQQAEGLTITGLVQNPRGGSPLERVTATALLFARDGSFIGSGRAPLDYLLLRPGDESPFVVTVAVSGTVARYRVSFRTEDGRVIEHVDRRTATEAVARSD